MQKNRGFAQAPGQMAVIAFVGRQITHYNSAIAANAAIAPYHTNTPGQKAYGHNT